MNNAIQPENQKKLKNMTCLERKMYLKEQRQIKKDSFKKMISYLNYRKGIFVGIIILNLIASIFLGASTYLLGYVTDNYLSYEYLNNPNYNTTSLTIAILLMGLFYFAQQGVNLWVNHLAIKAGMITTMTMRSKAYQSLMKMPISYFDASNSGELMSILSNDIENIANGLTGSLSPMFQTIFLVIASLGFMLYISPYLTLISIVLMVIFFSLVAILMTKAMPLFGKQQKRIASLNGYIEEHLAAHHLIKNYNKTKFVNEEFEIKNQKIYKTSFKSTIYTTVIYPYSRVATALMELIIIVIGAVFSLSKIGTGTGKIFTPGTLTSFVIYIRIMTNQVIRFFENMGQVLMASASTQRVFKLINLIPQVDQDTLSEINNIKGNVEFKNVNFSYNGLNDSLQLKNASFSAKRGQTIAIVGPTGAGKTTIINLLSKFYLPNSGDVMIDGHKSTDINEKSWRNQISIVLQDTFLFKTTILENLRYANLNATDDEIFEASRISKADDFIQKLENGYNEVVQEGGANFSQGERQLLAITRAIIANKNILILDEATSNVDTRTEKNIQKAMLELMKGKTSFVIAHRLSTIVTADLILVINNGQIIEQGKHLDLLKQNGFYAKLYNSSFDENA
ncbi:ABC transporter ATP-binding protein [Metamycoplasma buccale]|uniref:ABC transporter ATP-binding protein n=1 Tax=Metamycoplasma buccale TaxID=55602 RepID=UPI00398F49A3